MDSVHRVEVFLRTYEYNCTLEDVAPLVAQFSDPFQIATPHGTKVLDRATFAAGISRRKQLLKQMGCGEAEMVSVETMLLDHRYALARTQWKFSAANGSEPIFTESSFLIDDVQGTPKIVVYLSHDDLEGMLAARDNSKRIP